MEAARSGRGRAWRRTATALALATMLGTRWRVRAWVAKEGTKRPADSDGSGSAGRELAAGRTGDVRELLAEGLRTACRARCLGSCDREWRFYAVAEGAQWYLRDELPAEEAD
ncbi:hypothetical protein B1218_38265 [Pseudomonas ogarae]|nr:hypothetical protein B1218_38265 [Pseudomonas ogarae]